ncbi:MULTISPECIES: hypothetical protein [Kamptonema]|uniref:hypothetical protein n=1 Tax=Kamptonema TaxID=1501433 RepID=UPI0001DACC84|nr:MULTISPECIES: hypothetical protein [Kamptonema]CBN57526.1 hypothetical protein OSCI_3460048 [Kamptonema sp. PCC 6506]
MPNNESDNSALIAELEEAGIKHTPEKIVRIAKRLDGRIIFNGYIVGANPSSP